MCARATTKSVDTDISGQTLSRTPAFVAEQHGDHADVDFFGLLKSDRGTRGQVKHRFRWDAVFKGVTTILVRLAYRWGTLTFGGADGRHGLGLAGRFRR